MRHEHSLVNLFLQTIRALNPGERTLFQFFVLLQELGEMLLKKIPSGVWFPDFTHETARCFSLISPGLAADKREKDGR
jgi:hypothetical protein